MSYRLGGDAPSRMQANPPDAGAPPHLTLLISRGQKENPRQRRPQEVERDRAYDLNNV